ncbi:DUF4153 domain-containing protein [Nocardia asteroides]|uniref:DUF4153 domain-containing protein n=1 Tax=Nocardia asteroides TaxID=1824 RepID=UPI00341461A0
MPKLPPPVPRATKYWERVARPAGVLPAAAITGIIGATVIPIDRPGIGWLLAGTAVTGALCAVDYRARSRACADPPTNTAAAQASSASPNIPTPPVAGHLSATAGSAGTPPHTTPSNEQSTPTAEPTSASEATEVPAEANQPSSQAPESAQAHRAPGAADESPIAPPDQDAEPGSTKFTPTRGGTRSGLPQSASTAAAHAGSAQAAATGGVTQVGSGQPSSAGLGTAGRAPSAANAVAGQNESVTDAERPANARDRVWWAVAALVLLGVGTFRAAGWLFVLCVLAAGVAGSLAVLGRATRRGLLHDVAAVPVAVFGAVPWAFAGLRPGTAADSSTVRRYGASVAVTVALLVVFVPLLGGADATFAELLSGLVPTVDAATAWQWILLFGVVAAGALGALYLLAGPPAAATAVARPARTWARNEWMLPVGALTVLFAAFVGAQFVALFGGDDYVQRTAGLTYAEYARSGFWQLSAVSILTLAVILAVLRWAAQDSASDRRRLRILLSTVSVLALVIVGSALARMWTYQQAYGFTVLRLLVEVCELWVGLVYVLVLVAIARLRWSWVPRAAVGTALATLVALALLNPEHLVAERNVDRWEHGKRLDTGYLSRLSPDILPALTGLPPELRLEIEEPMRADLDDDTWWSWNLSRSAAR